jgi:archaellum biogenesis ATPase FlaH
MAGILDKIKGRSAIIKEQRGTSISKLVDLGDALSESLAGIDVYAESPFETLEMIGPDDWVYGALSFGQGGLRISYRTTEDDFHDSMTQLEPIEQSYDVKSIKSCPAHWLERLSSEKNVNQLLANIDKALTSIQENTIGSLESLNKALESQSEEIATETMEALKGYESEDLIRIWLKARSSIQTDSADSITRSSSYLESVCRLILAELGQELPNTRDITNLINAAIKALGLSDDAEANKDLKQLFGAIKGIFQAVGAMRTHFGSAHGFSPGDYMPPEHYARFVNDASATASTYLLRRLNLKLNK